MSTTDDLLWTMDGLPNPGQTKLPVIQAYGNTTFVPPTSPATVSVSPSVSTIPSSGTQVYTAVYSGSGSPTFAWSDGGAGGTFSPPNGTTTVYTAKPGPLNVTITCTASTGTSGIAALTVKIYYLLEILSTRRGMPAFAVAAGFLIANSGQTVSCTRASSAYALNNSGLLALLSANQPRVEPRGLLIEPTSTNQCLSSRDFGTTGFAKNNGLTLSNAVSPPSASSIPKAQLVQGTAGNSAPSLTSQAGNLTITGGSVYTWSLWAQAGTVSFISLRIGNTGNLRATFDVSNGATSLVSGGTVARTRYIPGRGGWFLCSVSGAATTGDNVVTFTFADTAAHSNAALDGTTWTVAGTESVAIWGGQFENLPIATSHIITGTVPVTRNADVVFVGDPLSALPQPLSSYSIRATATPLTTWDQGQPNTFLTAYFVSTGSPTAANQIRTYYQNVSSSVQAAQVAVQGPSAGVVINIPVNTPAGPSSTTLDLAAIVSGTNLSLQSSLGTGSGTVSNPIASFDSTVYIGGNSAGTNQFAGWLTDIAVNDS